MAILVSRKFGQKVNHKRAPIVTIIADIVSYCNVVIVLLQNNGGGGGNRTHVQSIHPSSHSQA